MRFRKQKAQFTRVIGKGHPQDSHCIVGKGGFQFRAEQVRRLRKPDVNEHSKRDLLYW
jgi:hypothetical protein